jgi:ATP-dependent Clp protease ATP-binding subunit ClpC
MVWKDSSGYFTAALVDAEQTVDCGFPIVGYAESSRAAILQVRELLKWYYARNPWSAGPTIMSSRLVSYKVKVRPEYRVEDRVFPAEQSQTLKVEVVDSLHKEGYRSAVIPRLEVEFFYTQGALKDLVRHYVREQLSGQPPHQVARYLPPEEVFLEYVSTRCPQPKPDGIPQANTESLQAVADPMGGKALKARYGRPYGREPQVAELVSRLSGRGSNVLIVGDQGCGKTSVLLEAVRKLEKNRGARGESPFPHRHWQTRGARLVAGMRYLGQWEERLEKVIAELADIEGVLCLENLLEVVQTGGLGPEGSVAAFLAPYLERAEIVIVAETTPRELDTCRRLLPNFVDLFGCLVLPEFGPSQSLSVLGQVAQSLATRYRVECDSNVISECYRLHRRFLPYHAFPGKASQFLRQLFEESAREQYPLDREQVVSRFSHETGLPPRLLRDEETWPCSEIREFFDRRVIGQPAANQAATALVSTFKAGLMAKAIARCFFGAGLDQERLVRLDMSEYGGPGATYRLLGSSSRPGELVRRVREQPFTVILLDEFEKAHPDVYDLLMGVFDEGRLTDPWGRTTTFRSTVIIMTSNLGVSSLGPVGIKLDRPPSYEAEVMRFFRPEFFNRIDSVIAFSALDPSSILAITKLELQDLGKREGILRRGLTLRWNDELPSYLAEKGYDPRYGARPLKRAIEELVVVPLARYLVEHPELSHSAIDIEVVDGQVLIG